MKCWVVNKLLRSRFKITKSVRLKLKKQKKRLRRIMVLFGNNKPNRKKINLRS